MHPSKYDVYFDQGDIPAGLDNHNLVAFFNDFDQTTNNSFDMHNQSLFACEKGSPQFAKDSKFSKVN